LTLAAIADVVIAVTVSYRLWVLKSGTVLDKSKNLIHQLILYSVEIGAITSIFAITIVLTYATMSNLIWLGLFSILPKCTSPVSMHTLPLTLPSEAVYANSLMYMLNSRLNLRRANRVSGYSATPSQQCPGVRLSTPSQFENIQPSFLGSANEK